MDEPAVAPRGGQGSCMITGMADQIVRCLLRDPPLRVIAAVTTDVLREAGRRHHAVGGALVALGRGATSGLLLATLTKGGEQVTLQVLGNGPLGALIIDAADSGDVRAYLKHPDVFLPGPPGQRVSIAAGIGSSGVISVIRDLGLRQPVSGQCHLRSGEVDEDVEEYLCTSEQIDSALGCEVLLGDSDVAVSAGVLVQCMPGGNAAPLVSAARERLRAGALSAALAGGMIDAAALARLLLGDRGRELELLDTRPVRFHCPCTKERMLDTLALLSDDELGTMIREEEGAEVTCNFCGEIYRASIDELEQARASRASHANN